MDYIYATFDADVMHDSKVMITNVSNCGIFQQKKSNIFIKNQDMEPSETSACSSGCLHSHKTN